MPVDAKTWLATNRPLLEPYIGKELAININGTWVTSSAILEDVTQAKLGELTNKPEMRLDENGKRYTPSCFLLRFDQGTLVFCAEDTTMKVLMYGFRFSIGAYSVEVMDAAYYRR